MPSYPPPYDQFRPDWNIQATNQPSHRDALSLALASQLVYRLINKGGQLVNEDETLAYDEKQEKESGEAAEQRICAQLTNWGVKNSKVIHVDKAHDIDTYGFVASTDSVILVTFRGSASWKNWIANIQAVKDPGPFDDTCVHEGFQDSLYPALLQFADAVQTFQTSNQPLWVTGHSLGGALAVLFTAMLLENGYTIGGLYTFGAPRVGNYAFQEAMDQRMNGKPHHRYVNMDDLVPQLPPEPFFSHAGHRMILNKDAMKPPTDSVDTWQSIKESFVRWYGQIKDRNLKIKDAHLLATDDGYLPRLLAAVKLD